jgi:phospholipid/cholesterol/gamma-HCH transport system substrate-binding protein
VESRANHLLVGSFVLLALVAIFAFVIWLARVELDQQVREYQIYFRGSVHGLGIGGEVNYRGIKVGTISRITVDPADPSRVGVVVRIDESTPLREGDVATLKSRGLTGVATINIEGATANSPDLVAAGENVLPEIPSRQSELERLFQDAPELLNRGILLAERTSELLGPQNQRLITATLTNINELTSTLASQKDSLASVLESMGSAGNEFALGARGFRELMARLNRLSVEASVSLDRLQATLAHVDRVLDEDTAVMVADVREASDSVNEVADETRALLVRNRASLDQFIGVGLVEFSRLVTEARLLLASLSRISERLESDGARFLIGDGESEFEAK